MKKRYMHLQLMMSLSLIVVNAQQGNAAATGQNIHDDSAYSAYSYGEAIQPRFGLRPQPTRTLPLNAFVTDRVRAGQMHVYAAHYTSGGAGGAMRLTARTHGLPLPSAATPLIIGVSNSRGGHTFTLPLPTVALHRHSSTFSFEMHDTSVNKATDSDGDENKQDGIMSVSRIMCPTNAAEDASFVTVGVGGGRVESNDSIQYGYQLRLLVLNASAWFLTETTPPVSVTVSAGAPVVFQYRWPKESGSVVTAVRVSIASGGRCGSVHGGQAANGVFGDAAACASMAIQRPVCPLTLTCSEILSAARYLSFTGCGTLVVPRHLMPQGFYVAVLLHDDNSECYPRHRDNKATPAARDKLVRLSIRAHAEQFGYVMVPVALTVGFLLIGVISFRVANVSETVADTVVVAAGDQQTNEDTTHFDEVQVWSENDREASARGVAIEATPVVSDTSAPMMNTVVGRRGLPIAPGPVISLPGSILFTCALLIMAFGINSVITDLVEERSTGNMDTCYRNDLCSHNAGRVPDINHLLSNVPYMGAGMGFLLAVQAQRGRYLLAAASGGENVADMACGVPHDFDLFQSLGAGLLLEGFTSGLYHVCPNNRNSHIDFFFIYYLYAALGAKLWQTRRGRTLRFHYTPALLVAAITLVGSLHQLVGGAYGWWVAMMVMHALTSMLWAAQMYRRGDFGLYWPGSLPTVPVPRGTRRIAITHLVLNLILVAVGLAASSAFSNFSTYALLFFTLNSGTYVAFYMLMKKLRHHEKPSPMSVLFLMLGLLVLVPALVMFVFQNPYNTDASPAVSRTSNAFCFNMGFFDAHDVWHFLSAAAIFCLLMGILTLDDDLLKTPRDKIPVF